MARLGLSWDGSTLSNFGFFFFFLGGGSFGLVWFGLGWVDLDLNLFGLAKLVSSSIRFVSLWAFVSFRFVLVFRFV